MFADTDYVSTASPRPISASSNAVRTSSCRPYALSPCSCYALRRDMRQVHQTVVSAAYLRIASALRSAAIESAAGLLAGRAGTEARCAASSYLVDGSGQLRVSRGDSRQFIASIHLITEPAAVLDVMVSAPAFGRRWSSVTAQFLTSNLPAFALSSSASVHLMPPLFTCMKRRTASQARKPRTEEIAT